MNRLKIIFTILITTAPLLATPPPITLEYAWTQDQINWGLMQRKNLPDNHGMLFQYKRPCTPLFWSFNCCLDLSVAFIDAHKIIREIKPLYAHPEKMDPSRPVNSPHDIANYPPEDPVVQYFLNNGVMSTTPIRYVLEMNLGWFEEHDVHVGDAIAWDVSSHTAVFKKAHAPN